MLALTLRSNMFHHTHQRNSLISYHWRKTDNRKQYSSAGDDRKTKGSPASEEFGLRDGSVREHRPPGTSGHKRISVGSHESRLSGSRCLKGAVARVLKVPSGLIGDIY